jgi:hypothetical protein
MKRSRFSEEHRLMPHDRKIQGDRADDAGLRQPMRAIAEVAPSLRLPTPARAVLSMLSLSEVGKKSHAHEASPAASKFRGVSSRVQAEYVNSINIGVRIRADRFLGVNG